MRKLIHEEIVFCLEHVIKYFNRALRAYKLEEGWTIRDPKYQYLHLLPSHLIIFSHYYLIPEKAQITVIKIHFPKRVQPSVSINSKGKIIKFYSVKFHLCFPTVKPKTRLNSPISNISIVTQIKLIVLKSKIEFQPRDGKKMLKLFRRKIQFFQILQTTFCWYSRHVHIYEH